MNNQKMGFTTEEALAICEMITKAVKDGYDVLIGLGEYQDDHANEGQVFRPYTVDIINDDGNLVSWDSSCSLKNALEEAWAGTAEE